MILHLSEFWALDRPRPLFSGKRQRTFFHRFARGLAQDFAQCMRDPNIPHNTQFALRLPTIYAAAITSDEVTSVILPMDPDATFADNMLLGLTVLPNHWQRVIDTHISLYSIARRKPTTT